MADGTTATWSTDGELVALTLPATGSSSLTYDDFGRVKTITGPDGATGTYRYDGLGRRVSLRVAGQIVRRYLYGTSRFPLARLDASGDVLERYVYGAQDHVPDLILRRDGTKLRVLTDALGSVRAVIDLSNGAVVERLTYDAYGRVTSDTAPGTQPFGFKGALADPAATGAGLIWMGSRAYQPNLARFSTPDPLGTSAAWNEHDAFSGDPINLTDVNGLFSFPGSQTIANFAAGFGDTATFGFTRWARQGLGWDDNTDYCSFAYGAGSFAGDMWLGAAGGAALGAAGGAVLRGTRGARGVAGADMGLASRGVRPLPGTRTRPPGIPDTWRIRGTKAPGGTEYYDPANRGNSVRVMQGNPKSPYPNSQGPYVRAQRNGQPLDGSGNVLPSAKDQAANIPLDQFGL